MASPKRKVNPASPNLPLPEQLGAVVLPIPTPPPIQHNERDMKSAPERIGNILKRERERRGDDLQQIADYLCIRRTFLVALESSRYDEFPADAYIIGFLRSYAEYLGLDGKETIDYYRREMAGRRQKPSLSMPMPISEGRAPSAIILAVAALAALLIYAVWYGISTADRAAVSSPPASPQSLSAPDTPATVHAESTSSSASAGTDTVPSPPTSAQPQAALVQAPSQQALPVPTASVVHEDIVLPAPSSAVAGMPAAAGAAPSSHLTIKAEQSSWVLVADAKGHTIFDHVMKPGETYAVPDQKGLVMTTGNGAGILLTLDGAELPKLSAGQGRILRNISLEPPALKSMSGPPSSD